MALVFHSPQAFAKHVCKDKGLKYPRTTCYLVEDKDGNLSVLSSAPKSYRKLHRVTFCVDGERVAIRLYGLWVEAPSFHDELLVMKHQLRKTLDHLREEDVAKHLTDIGFFDAKHPYLVSAPKAHA